uniref:Rpn family recombination-promoting nuclease/putative transposase n=1 Tax=Gracilinema caldarium TaxID=215591 RepID=A0A7C3E3G5_9SPIR
MTQPHDYGYKDLFSHPQIIKELLTSCVKEFWVQDLDFSRASTIDKSFITASKKKLESDLIWRIPLKSGQEIYLYILLEFQSTVDHFMALRILRYLLEFYSSLLKQDPKRKVLPPVFPILLYNGEARWTAPENIADLIDNRNNLDFMPQFRYFKIAENEFSTKELLSLKNLIGALFLVETTAPTELEGIFRHLRALLEHEQPEVYRAFLSWLYNFFSKPVPDWVREQLDPKEAPTMLATNLKKWEQELIQQGLQEGMFKGKQEGLQEGIQQGFYEGERRKALSTAKKLKQKGLTIPEIAEVTGLSVEEVEKL